MSTHMANQVNQYKSTNSLIPPIREVEDECWTNPRPLPLWRDLGHHAVKDELYSQNHDCDDGDTLFFPCSTRGFEAIENWKGLPMCIPLMLLPYFYICIHSDVHNDNQVRIVQPLALFEIMLTGKQKKKKGKKVLPVIHCNISPLPWPDSMQRAL